MVRRAAIGVLLFLGMVAIAVGLWKVTPGSPGARRGPGLLHKRGDPSGWRDARAHRQGGAQVLEAIKSNPNNQDAVAFTVRFPAAIFRNNAATIFVTQKPWDERKVDTKQVVGDLL